MKPEGKVKSEVSQSLASLELAGDVIWFERLNSLSIHQHRIHINGCRSGTFDFIAAFKAKHGGLSLCFIECKRSDIAPVLSESQNKFKNKYDGKHVDIHFWLVQSGKEAERLILKHAFNRVSAIDWEP